MKLFLLLIFIVLCIQKGLAECGGFQIESSGWISAPKEGTDPLYINNADCMWLIEVYGSKAIQIQFHEMDIEEDMVCEYDYIKIHDGLTPKIYHCGTELPQDFISDTRLAVVTFISDGSIRKSGFNLTYTHIEDPTCGYRTWRHAGRFGSFDTDLKPGMCTWAIQGPRSYVALKLFVTKLNILQSEGCELEYIEIYDDYEVFGRYCGLENMTVITTTENVLYVDLKSSGNNDNLFEAYYARTELHGNCGDIMIQPSGIISSYDGDHDGKYDDNQNCFWTVIAPADKVIRLEFLEFELEELAACNYDYVQIYDGPFEDWAILARYCGFHLPPVMWTTSNILTVNFQSDHTFGLRGFNATYTHEEERQRECEETLTQPSGYIHSPDKNSDGFYEPRQDCLWRITASEDQVIVLKFLLFDLEFSSDCDYDYVEIFDGGFDGSFSLGKYCGIVLPPNIRSTSNVLVVHFISDGLVQWLGFNITYSVYQSTERQRECEETLTQPSGYIHSPDKNSDGFYEPRQDCLWRITASEDQVIVLKFLLFDLEFSSDCDYDYVEIFDGGFDGSFSLGKYCGIVLPPTIRSTSNVLVVHFISDGLMHGLGFNITYSIHNATDRFTTVESFTTQDSITTIETSEEMVESTTVSKVDTTESGPECKEFLNQPSGFIHSPDADNDGQYETNQNCNWTLTAPEGHVIYLKFLEFDTEFDVECIYDFVEIWEVFDSELGRSAVSVGRYCGGRLPPVIWSNSNVLVIHFLTDIALNRRGFNATYRFYNETERDSFTTVQTREESTILHTMESTVQTTEESTSENQTGCGEVLTQPVGFIHTPDRDNDGEYETNQDCYWTLTALEYQVIYLDFLYFYVEYEENCEWDYVEIQEVSGGVLGGSVSSIGKYCGISSPSPIWSTTNVLLVHFHSDSYATEAGFNATYRHYNATDRDSFTTEPTTTYKTTTENQVECEEFLTASSGFIHSPDSDNDGNYELNQDCFWTIMAGEGYVIHFKFLEFDLEYEENCNYDYVEIHEVSDGEIEESLDFTGKFCGPVRPPDIWSTSNILLVHFHSDEYVNEAGFNATFRHYDEKVLGDTS